MLRINTILLFYFLFTLLFTISIVFIKKAFSCKAHKMQKCDREETEIWSKAALLNFLLWAHKCVLSLGPLCLFFYLEHSFLRSLPLVFINNILIQMSPQIGLYPSALLHFYFLYFKFTSKLAITLYQIIHSI